MTDEQFDALCEANSFGAVTRGEFPLVPRALLKALVDAAVAAERERIAAWLAMQRNDTPAQGLELAAALRACGPNLK
jgi:hypothetical protein